MRLFLGIFPEKENLDRMRDILRKFTKQKRNLKTIPIDQLHLTIKFLGSKVSERSLNILTEELKSHAGNFGKAKVKIKGLQFGFPKQSSPKVLMARVEPNAELNNIVAFIHKIVKELKLRDTITWKPYSTKDYHISLARIKDNSQKRSGKLIQSIAKEYSDLDFGEFLATEMYLVESEFRVNKGVTYRKLERITL